MQVPKTTRVFDTFWRFAIERQEIFFRRIRGDAPPWTRDAILQAYRFTNVYRAADRVSQYLIKNVIYRGDQTHEEVSFRTTLFRMFNRIETWETLETEIGFPTATDFSLSQYGQALDRCRQRGERLYGGAYIIPPVRGYHDARKHRTHLSLLGDLVATRFFDRLADASSMKDAYELLRTVPSFGKFLAYQLLIDLNYGPTLGYDEMDFVVAGPGAQSGLRKCFRGTGGWTDEDLIRWVTDNQVEEVERRGLSFRSLWGRPLHLVDVQNLFCEIDKYARVAHPTVDGTGGRTRLKRRYQPKPLDFRYLFPPKWKLGI